MNPMIHEPGNDSAEADLQSVAGALDQCAVLTAEVAAQVLPERGDEARGKMLAVAEELQRRQVALLGQLQRNLAGPALRMFPQVWAELVRCERALRRGIDFLYGEEWRAASEALLEVSCDLERYRHLLDLWVTEELADGLLERCSHVLAELPGSLRSVACRISGWPAEIAELANPAKEGLVAEILAVVGALQQPQEALIERIGESLPAMADRWMLALLAEVVQCERNIRRMVDRFDSYETEVDVQADVADVASTLRRYRNTVRLLAAK